MTNEDRMTLRFLGVRGSYPVPGPSTLKFGGNTSCIEITAGNHRIILDAGTGLIQLGDELFQEYRNSQKENYQGETHILTFLFSHTHHDHTQGLPFFKPIFLPATTAFLFGPRSLEQSFLEGLRKAMASPYFPVNLEDLQSVRVIRPVKPNEIIVFQEGSLYPEVYNVFRERDLYSNAPLKIWVNQSYAHPDGGVYNYRVQFHEKSVVYATDTEGYAGGDIRLIRFARNVDVLIHDSQYLTEDYLSTTYPVQGFGHSTCEMAAETAKAANVKKLFLYHYDPQYNDEKLNTMVEQARATFPETEGAREGMVYSL